MPSEYSDAMLKKIIEEAKRALSTQDPASRAGIISDSIQPYAGWALRWAVEDCRAHGLTWQVIASMLGKSYPAVLRQYEAGGPVYVVTPAQSANSGNFDAQTPLRRAATALGNHMAGLYGRQRDRMTYALLVEAASKVTEAQGNIDDPAPLLRACYEFTSLADRIRLHAQSQPMTRQERETWTVIDELKAAYQRDKTEIETAHQVMTQVADAERSLIETGVKPPPRPLHVRVVKSE